MLVIGESIGNRCDWLILRKLGECVYIYTVYIYIDTHITYSESICKKLL